jgi:hypothetical protein
MLFNTKLLLGLTAVGEFVVGVLLVITPSAAARLLLGAGLASPESILVGRMAGAALLSIGVICWLSRNQQHRNCQPVRVIGGLLVYNAAIAILLLYAAVVDKMDGIGIWPTIGLHFVLLVWCAGCLRHLSWATGEANLS